MTHLLRLTDVHAGYGDLTVVHGMSIQVRADSITVLLGANGAGKTTLINTISGVVKPRSGQILFQGESIVGVAADRVVERGVVQVPEGRRLFPFLTVDENLRLGAYPKGARKHFNESRDLVCELFPVLAPRLGQFAGTLSGGEQQMVAIGRGLMARPKLLMLDEPSLGLAPLMVELVFEKIAELKAAGVAVLLVEQNASEALELADWAYVVEGGTVVMEGVGRNLIQDPLLQRAYLGL